MDDSAPPVASARKRQTLGALWRPVAARGRTNGPFLATSLCFPSTDSTHFIRAFEWHDRQLLLIDAGGAREFEDCDMTGAAGARRHSDRRRLGWVPTDSTKSAPVLIGLSTQTAKTSYSVKSRAIGVTSLYFSDPTPRTSLASKVGPLMAMKCPVACFFAADIGPGESATAAGLGLNLSSSCRSDGVSASILNDAREQIHGAAC